MSKTVPLLECKKQVKAEMGGYRSLPEYLLDGVGVLFERMIHPSGSRKRGSYLPGDASTQENEGFPSYWLNSLAIGLATFLVGWLVSLLLGEDPKQQWVLSVWASATGMLALIANKVNIRAFLNTFRFALLDRMQMVEDVENLGHWLKSHFKLTIPLLFGLGVGPALAWMLYGSWRENNGAPFQVGTFVTILLASVQAVWVAYYLYPFYVAFPSRLNQYHFDLFTPDPSSSEVVGRLSRLLTFILYVTLGFIVQLTIGLTLLGVLTERTPAAGLVFSVFVWAPTVILYAASQYHLSDLISRAKWRMLNEVQEKIEGLYGNKKIPDTDTLERLEKLMNYHERIKSTPNSALNFRASLNFLNSLLLPILAFVAANLGDVIDAINRLLAGGSGP